MDLFGTSQVFCNRYIGLPQSSNSKLPLLRAATSVNSEKTCQLFVLEVLGFTTTPFAYLYQQFIADGDVDRQPIIYHPIISKWSRAPILRRRQLLLRCKTINCTPKTIVLSTCLPPRPNVDLPTELPTEVTQQIMGTKQVQVRARTAPVKRAENRGTKMTRLLWRWNLL